MGPAHSSTRHITINEQPFQIRDNLCQALESLDSLWFSRNAMEMFGILRLSPAGQSDQLDVLYDYNFLWVDAICINQEDVLERNHQVQMMRDIYSSADSVAAWLGPNMDDALLAIITDKWEVLFDGTNGTRRPHPDTLPFAHAAYWSRIWIIQEFLLAGKVLFFSESHVLPFEDYKQRIRRVLWFNALDQSSNRATTIFNERDSNRLTGRPLSPSLLAELIIAFSAADCADPRDKIYALLGLATLESPSSIDHTNSTFRADYALSTVDLYDKLHTYLPSYMHPCLRRVEPYLLQGVPSDVRNTPAEVESST
jgi:hypothetical protein